jgi:hypothetical protein
VTQRDEREAAMSSETETQGRRVLVHAHEALDYCARAMDDETMSRADPAQRDDVRSIFLVAGQVRAADQIARMRIQSDDRVPIPRWLHTRYSTSEPQS